MTEALHLGLQLHGAHPLLCLSVSGPAMQWATGCKAATGAQGSQHEVPGPAHGLPLLCTDQHYALSTIQSPAIAPLCSCPTAPAAHSRASVQGPWVIVCRQPGIVRLALPWVEATAATPGGASSHTPAAFAVLRKEDVVGFDLSPLDFKQQPETIHLAA